jgi:hemerythrin
MESFVWEPCFVTGLDMVDEQHHRLVELINRFGDLLVRPQGASVVEVEDVFGKLAAYAEYHFREEEGLMENAHLDPRYVARHRKQHAKFLLDLTRLHAGMGVGQRDAAMPLLNFLTDWLAYHILGTDQVMAKQHAAIQAGSTPEQAYLADNSHADPATATLLHALDRLFHQVSERNRALYELNQTLEARVAERTHALSEANQRLEDMALTDVLTGLPNRRHALRRLQTEWQQSQAHNEALACMMIDADGFKQINDSQGHDAGDEVLRQLAHQLRDAARNDDAVCRLGGDEFLIICPATPLEGALRAAEKIRQQVAAMRVPAGQGEWRGSISVGVAARDGAMAGFEDLLKASDEAVYQAKRNGRNCVAAWVRP